MTPTHWVLSRLAHKSIVWKRIPDNHAIWSTLLVLMVHSSGNSGSTLWYRFHRKWSLPSTKHAWQQLVSIVVLAWDFTSSNGGFVQGRVSNIDHSKTPVGSAQRKRELGYRPRSGLWQRKDGRHGLKIRRLPPMRLISAPASPPKQEIRLTEVTLKL